MFFFHCSRDILLYKKNKTKTGMSRKWGGKRITILTGDQHVTVMSSVIEKLQLVGKTQPKHNRNKTIFNLSKVMSVVVPWQTGLKLDFCSYIYKKHHWCGKYRCRDCKIKSQRIFTTQRWCVFLTFLPWQLAVIHRSLPSMEKSSDNRSSSPQCVTLSHLYKYKITNIRTRTHTHTRAHSLVCW